jgi:hypothetical protein
MSLPILALLGAALALAAGGRALRATTQPMVAGRLPV